MGYSTENIKIKGTCTRNIDITQTIKPEWFIECANESDLRLAVAHFAMDNVIDKIGDMHDYVNLNIKPIELSAEFIEAWKKMK